MSSDSLPRLALIHRYCGCSDRIISAVVKNFIYDRPLAEWPAKLTAAGFKPDQLAALRLPVNGQELYRLTDYLRRHQISILTINDQRYPRWLKEIPSPPPLLYLRGSDRVLNRPALAVVGTRRPSPYGVTVTERLVAAAARAGLVIVSGLASGIDAVAHRTALRCGGLTVAVMGTGIDLVYPADHAGLVNDIIAGGGAIVSEFPLGTDPARYNFPRRNRIISGLAQATLITEAGDKSGALITAKFALDQNRELLVVPGSILSPTSVGTNSWLRLGARPVLSATDLLAALNGRAEPTLPTAAPLPPPTDPVAARVFDHLGTEPIHIDGLAERCRLDSSAVAASLALLEIDGHVRHLGGMNYVRG